MLDHRPDEEFAKSLDGEDPLRGFRERFCIPAAPDGQPVVYFCGNSLGLLPAEGRRLAQEELDAWAEFGVDGHFKGRRPWYSYHEQFRDRGARLVGARPGEVVMMNSLTVNLHLMMVTFYRPTQQRYKVLIESPTFPSDLYAIETQIRHHGFDPADALVTLQPREGEHHIHTADVEGLLEDHGDQIALVLLAGVNFNTGQVLDMPRIADVARREGCVFGLDLAHAVGNVPLSLHDWGIDFAVWCNYKYLNSGPGAIGGCFVHERHGKNLDLPRFAGWWGNDPATRFEMHRRLDFIPQTGADGWQISNPPILSAAPLLASLALFDEAGMEALRSKSIKLTGYLEYLLDRIEGRRFEIITPRDPAARGCQLSILVHDDPRGLYKTLRDENIVVDFREPNVIRIAPVPLYNTFHEVWRFAEVLANRSEPRP
jgi:kynureninase